LSPAFGVNRGGELTISRIISMLLSTGLVLDVVFGDRSLAGADVLFGIGSDDLLEMMLLVVFRTSVSGVDLADLN